MTACEETVNVSVYSPQYKHWPWSCLVATGGGLWSAWLSALYYDDWFTWPRSSRSSRVKTHCALLGKNTLEWTELTLFMKSIKMYGHIAINLMFCLKDVHHLRQQQGVFSHALLRDTHTWIQKHAKDWEREGSENIITYSGRKIRCLKRAKSARKSGRTEGVFTCWA